MSTPQKLNEPTNPTSPASPSTLTIRRLLVDLETPPPRHWNGDDAFRTALFDALSFSFPAGEQIFIDAVRRGLAELPEDQRERFAEEAKAFIGQEATHRRVHTLYNEHLVARGLVNVWEPRILRDRETILKDVGTRNWLAMTAATEHFTAIFAEWVLTNEAPLAGADPRWRDLWLWHSAEESEHRSTAFDLYRALGGDELWRRRIYLVVTRDFIVELTLQTLSNLRRDGTLWRWRTWASAARILFGRGGLLRAVVPRWKDYRRADFHPSQGNGAPGQRWLAAHGHLAPPVTARA